MTTPPLDHGHTLLMVAMLALGIMATRFIPFLLFGGGRTLPDRVLYLGRVLPHASMTLLLVYCLKDVSVLNRPYGMPELLAIGFTALIHRWRGNVLVSIAGGTAFYMFLVQRIFV